MADETELELPITVFGFPTAFKTAATGGHVLRGTILLRGFRDHVAVEAHLPGHEPMVGRGDLPRDFPGNLVGLNVVVPLFLDLPYGAMLPSLMGGLSGALSKFYGAPSFSGGGEVGVERPDSEITPPPAPRRYDYTFALPAGDSTGDTIVFKTAEAGQTLRKTFNLDAIDDEQKLTLIQIPHDTLLLTDKFFDGLFGNSVRKLRYLFNNRYEFDCDAALRPSLQRKIRNYERFGL